MKCHPLFLRVPLLLCTAACGAPVLAQTTERTPVPDPRPVMIAAIDSPTGEAHGVLVGAMADAITRKFTATTPIYVDVSTQRRYQQPGCSRLKVLVWQDGVLLPGAKSPKKQTVEMGISYCRDGSPPRSLW